MYRSLIFVGLISMILGSAPALAQSDGETSDVGYDYSELKLPNIGGHVFTPNNLVEDPFIRTYFKMTMGLGQAFDVQTNLLVVDSTVIVGLKGDVAFLGIDVEYSQAIKEWIAFRASIQISGRLGTNVGTLLSNGISTASGYEMGWLVKLLQSNKVILSGDLSFSNRSFTIISVSGFVDDIIEGRRPELTRKVPSTRVTAGARASWGVSELFGLTGILNTGYGESINPQEGDKIFYTVGANADFDLRAFSPVPIGVSLGFLNDSFPEGGEDVASNVMATNLKIAYNGRPDFSIGLAFTGEQFKTQTTDQSVRFGSVGFDLRYFF